MPVKFTIAQSYIDDMDNVDEQRVFHPQQASDQQFREFMVAMFMKQQSANSELSTLIKQQSETISGLNEKVTLLERDNNEAHVHRDAEMKTLQEENTSLRNQLETVINDVSNMNTKYDHLYDRSLDQERHSRGFNLRFPNIEECTTREARAKEDCISKIKSKLELVGLGHVGIENAHRVGPEPPSPDRPRSIIVRFLLRPERKLIWNKRKEMFQKRIPVFEDLCKPDRDRKAKYADVIKGHYDAGKKVWFSRGYYYIEGVKQSAMV